MGAKAGSLVLVLLLAAVLAFDLTRPPARQISSWALLGAIDLYQATWSRVLAKGGTVCRFEPTCSHYAEGAIRERGALRGGWAALARLARCGPWTPAGTVDPP